MTRVPFLAALVLTAAVVSQPRAVGPRRPGGGRPAAGRPAAPRPATPTFARPQAPRHVARPTIQHQGFVPARRPTAGRGVRQAPRPATQPRLTTTRHPNRPPVTLQPRPAGPRIVNRPQMNRTTINSPTVNRNRTTVNRTNIVNRTNVDVRNRSVTRNNVTVNRWGRGGRQVGAPRSWYTAPGNWGRSWWGGRPAWTWGRPWYWQHAGWHHGFWNYWVRPPALWFGAGLTAGWFLSPGDSFAYVNPYYVAPPVGVPVFDYSVPLPAVPADEDALALPPDPDDLAEPDAAPVAPAEGTAAEANRLLDRAREDFRAGQYAQAEVEVDTAIRLTPSDPTLHEFRALALFAQGNYKDAAAALYAVLTAGPGWDWATMQGLYPDVATYTAQLRTLERFVADNPTAAYGHFVAAYHYLVIGSKDTAVRELREVVRLQPDDKLAQALLTSLTAPAAGDVSPPPEPGR